jgi:magnesium transporter
MSTLIKKTSVKIGLRPGALVHIGEKKIEKPRIRIIDYNPEQLEEVEVETIEECFPYADNKNATWVNIDGLHDIHLIEKIGNHFNLHPLLLEDILNTEKRPEIEDYGDFIFMVVKMLYYDDVKGTVMSEQLSIVLGKNVVISFQERVGDVFNPIRERIRNSKGRIRNGGTDYLAYALIDTIVDNYFIILEKFSDRLETLEEELIGKFSQMTLKEIHAMKREMVMLRKSVWPLRELVNGMERSESRLINKSTVMFIKDLYDHTVQVIDTIETLREMLSGMLDIYLSNTSNKMNEVMKVLTIMASIFIPLTFIAGIYGMNFEGMPELHASWGYPVTLALMLIIAISMVFYFKRRKWF